LTLRTANVTLDEGAVQAYGISSAQAVQTGAWVCLTVEDTGCGMDAETQQRIFEPFFTTKDPGKGTGLGLSTSYGIIQQSGGFIGLQSCPGQGTAFHIFFPQAEPVAEDEPNEPQVSSHRSAGPSHILLVDDEDALRGYLAKALRSRGYNVMDVATGEEAVALVRKDNPPIDLLISDVIMPGMTGPQIVKELMTTHPALKLIFISGYTDDFLERSGPIGPEATLLAKPFHVESLIAAIHSTLGESVSFPP
jgi:two-component system cell cycle sensor histidine kinase/response regulator CckA